MSNAVSKFNYEILGLFKIFNDSKFKKDPVGQPTTTTTLGPSTTTTLSPPVLPDVPNTCPPPDCNVPSNQMILFPSRHLRFDQMT